MSFFKRMFGGTTAAEERAAADRLYAEGDVMGARQAYERALERDKGADRELAAHCHARVVACFDALAHQRMDEAETFRREGELDMARTELETAVELARSPAVKEKARRAIEVLERRDAVQAAAEPTELTEDERWAVIVGNWEERQIEEHDGYGETLRTALLDLHDGKTEQALVVLEQLARENENATYLWLESGRARLEAKDEDGGAKALRRFLKRLREADDEGDEDRSDARLAAHIALSAIAEKAGDEEKAITWLNKAIEVMSDDPRPYLQLGMYLRQKGHPEEAVEVLDTAISLLDEDRPSWEAYQELGLAKADAGHDEEAIDLLEKVTRFFVSRQRLDFPRSTALPLARLYEKAGRLERAADLYRSLANGSDRANHLEYHREAGRVLTELGLATEARRMLTRAAALAEEKPDVLAEVEAKIAALDAQLER